jgi:uncharacterized protein YkwD
VRLLVVAVLGVVALGALPGGGTAAPAGAKLALSSLELTTIAQINEVRVQNGLVPLEVSTALFDSASEHCADMVANGYFAHTSPSGAGIWDRLAAFYPAAGHSFYDVGENLFWASGRMSGAAMVAAWMNSPEHRRNLLDPEWRQVGVATLSVPLAPGVYAGQHVTVVTADFGVRR